MQNITTVSVTARNSRHRSLLHYKSPFRSPDQRRADEDENVLKDFARDDGQFYTRKRNEGRNEAASVHDLWLQPTVKERRSYTTAQCVVSSKQQHLFCREQIFGNKSTTHVRGGGISCPTVDYCQPLSEVTATAVSQRPSTQRWRQ